MKISGPQTLDCWLAVKRYLVYLSIYDHESLIYHVKGRSND